MSCASRSSRSRRYSCKDSPRALASAESVRRVGSETPRTWRATTKCILPRTVSAGRSSQTGDRAASLTNAARATNSRNRCAASWEIALPWPNAAASKLRSESREMLADSAARSSVTIRGDRRIRPLRPPPASVAGEQHATAAVEEERGMCPGCGRGYGRQ